MTVRFGLWVAVFVVLVSCEKDRFGPQPDAPLGASAAGPSAPVVVQAPAAPMQILDRTRMRAGDWVEYDVSGGGWDGHTRDSWKGRVRLTVASADAGGGIVRIQALEGGTGDLWARLGSQQDWRMGGRTTTRTEKRKVAGREWTAQVRSFDQRQTDGPRGEAVFAFDAPELAVSGSVLSWGHWGAGMPGYGGSSLELRAFGHADPPEIPKSISPDDAGNTGLDSLLTMVLTRETEPDEGY